MNREDAEKIFELEGDYTLEDVRDAYKRLAVEFHPDQHSNTQAATFFMQQINEAKDLLDKQIETENASNAPAAGTASAASAAGTAQQSATGTSQQNASQQGQQSTWADDEARRRRAQAEAERLRQEREKREKQAQEHYELACKLIDADDMNSLQKAQGILSNELSNHPDAPRLIQKCQKRMAELTEQQRAKGRRRTIIKVVIPLLIIVALVVYFFVLPTIMPAAALTPSTAPIPNAAPWGSVTP